MISQSFDACVQFNGGVTTETVKMRTALAEEYGLVEAGSTEFVESMLETFGKWGEGTITNTGTVITQLDNAAARAFNLKEAIEALPSVKEITVRINQEGSAEVTWGGSGPALTERAAGGPVYAGRPYMVGEGGPELFVPRQTGDIVNHQRTQQITRTLNMGDTHINNGMDVAMLQAVVERAMMAGMN